MISMECQIEANPMPSYVWYEMSGNISSGMAPSGMAPSGMAPSGMMPYYGQQNPYGQQYPLQPVPNLPTAGLNVFGTTRQIQRIYQNPGQHAMLCQAQSRGKTMKQEFIITVNRKLLQFITGRKSKLFSLYKIVPNNKNLSKHSIGSKGSFSFIIPAYDQKEYKN